MKNNKITVEIKVVNKDGEESTQTFVGTYGQLHNNDWNEITRLFIDEAVSEKEF
jgi:hypothetical protein